jgi:uncharacterized protein YjbJ (UPF0337 family)
MSQNDTSIHQQAKNLKHEGWKDQAAGTMKKVVGKVTNDKGLQNEGEMQKQVGDAERTTGKFIENVTK